MRKQTETNGMYLLLATNRLETETKSRCSSDNVASEWAKCFYKLLFLGIFCHFLSQHIRKQFLVIVSLSVETGLKDTRTLLHDSLPSNNVNELISYR